MTHSSGGGGDAKLNIVGKEELKRKSSNLMDPQGKVYILRGVGQEKTEDVWKARGGWKAATPRASSALEILSIHSYT